MIKEWPPHQSMVLGTIWNVHGITWSIHAVWGDPSERKWISYLSLVWLGSLELTHQLLSWQPGLFVLQDLCLLTHQLSVVLLCSLLVMVVINFIQANVSILALFDVFNNLMQVPISSQIPPPAKCHFIHTGFLSPDKRCGAILMWRLHNMFGWGQSLWQPAQRMGSVDHRRTTLDAHFSLL